MPSGGAKMLLIFAGLGMAVLMLVGFIYGAIGSAMFGIGQILQKPEIHLAPQPIFPSTIREKAPHLNPESVKIYNDFLAEEEKHEAEELAKNPDFEPLNKGKKYPAEPLDDDEVRSLIRACSNRAPTGIRNRALIVVLWRAQLRVSEVQALTAKDVD